jgi:hypothetical protein
VGPLLRDRRLRGHDRDPRGAHELCAGEKEAELENYVPDEAKIKVTLGLKDFCVATPDEAVPVDNGVPDINAKGMWMLAGAQGMPDDA